MKEHYEGLLARLVWDGTDEVRIPPELGTPNEGQMIGTASERLAEIGGRTCYDSLGAAKSRSSKDYHPHIREVKHTSVNGHHHFTVAVPVGQAMNYSPKTVVAIYQALMNRPGIWLNTSNPEFIRITTNLRAVTEWEKWTKRNRRYYDGTAMQAVEVMGTVLNRAGKKVAPQIVTDTIESGLQYLGVRDNSTLVEPEDDSERWITLYVEGSRGFSHELVRHGFQTGISQRCISGDASVAFVNGNNTKHRYHTIKWLHDNLNHPRIGKSVRALRPRVLDEASGLFSSGKLLDVVHSGKKPCFKVSLKNGREITCTKDHRIYTNRGWMTLDEIASPKIAKSVVEWNKSNGVLIATNGVSVVGNGLYKDKEWLEQRYIKDDADVAAIASETGATASTVRTYLSRLGIKKRELASYDGSLVQDREWLHEQYRVLGLSHEEIAEKAGCTPHVVHNYCRKFGIQKTMNEVNLGREPWNKGATYSHTKPYSPEAIERYRQSKLGPKNPQWKGGRGSEARRAFNAWRRHNGKKVFERDGWTCRMCNRHASQIEYNSAHMKKRRIEIHHILPLWNRPDLACDINNMATVCWQCQAGKLNGGRELDHATALLEAIKSPVEFKPSDRKLIVNKRKLVPHYVEISSITFAGEIDTYDLVLEGPNHGFVANGVVVHNSTRFVDEDESPWGIHPLIQEFIIDETQSPEDRAKVKDVIAEAEAAGKKCYGTLVKILQPFAKSRIKDDPYAAATARKQARGASRGYLGNALKTAIIFSAAVEEWKWILGQRAANAADGEIRCEFSQEVLPELKKSRYAASFAKFEVEPAVDGVGYALKGGGNK